MYVIAFFLDLIGYFCLLLFITIILAPLALIIQGITSFLGSFILTIWILFFRHSPISAAKKIITRKGSKNKKEQKDSDKNIKESESSDSSKSGGASLSASASQPSFDDHRPDKMPVKTTSLLKKWIKRVLLPFLIESVPLLGKISPTWVIAVHLEATHA